jgi:hypothetical protein
MLTSGSTCECDGQRWPDTGVRHSGPPGDSGDVLRAERETEEGGEELHVGQGVRCATDTRLQARGARFYPRAVGTCREVHMARRQACSPMQIAERRTPVGGRCTWPADGRASLCDLHWRTCLSEEGRK